MIGERLQDGNSQHLTLREFLLHSVLLLVAVAILFPATFLHGEHITPAGLLFDRQPWAHYAPSGYQVPPNDLPFEALTTFYYWYGLSKQALDGGEWPLWNPQQFCGVPLMANFQSAVFYPLRLLHAVFDVHFATTLYMLLRVWLCGATAYIAARGIGLGIAASRFMSLGWMLCMLNMVWLYWPVPDVCAWAPLLLLGVERALQGRYRQSFFTIALSGTLILIAGHPESALMFGMGIGAYFLLRLLLERRTGRSLVLPLVVVGGAWIPALLLCAVQLIPFGEYVINSYTFTHRSEAADVVQKLLFRGLVAFWVPRFFGSNADGNFWGLYDDASVRVRDEIIINTNHVSYLYVGMVAWIAIVAAVCRTRSDRLVRHRVVAVLVPGTLGLFLATEHPLLGFVHDWPVFSVIIRTYYALFPILGLVFLAALGVDELSKGAITASQRRALIVGALMIVVVVAGTYAVERSSIIEAGVQAYVWRETAIAILFVFLALGVFVFGCYANYRRVACAVLALLLTCDLLYAARGLRPTARYEDILPRTALFDRLHETMGDGRVVLLTARIPAGVSQMYGFEITGGYDAILPSRVQEFLENTRTYMGTIEPIMGATLYVFAGAPFDPVPARFDVVDTVDGFTIYRNRNTLPRAFLVGSVESVPDMNAVFERMAEPGFDPSRLVVTSEPVPAFGDEGQDNVGEARVTERRLNSTRIDVRAERRCMLVLSDAYYPGWRVYLDGAPSTILPVYHAFRGVVVPEGEHEIVFEYDPPSFRWGLLISALTGLLCSAVAAVWTIRLMMSTSSSNSRDDVPAKPIPR